MTNRGHWKGGRTDNRSFRLTPIESARLRKRLAKGTPVNTRRKTSLADLLHTLLDLEDILNLHDGSYWVVTANGIPVEWYYTKEQAEAGLADYESVNKAVGLEGKVEIRQPKEGTYGPA